MAESNAAAAVNATHGAVGRVVTLVDIPGRQRRLAGEKHEEKECEAAHDVRWKTLLWPLQPLCRQ